MEHGGHVLAHIGLIVATVAMLFAISKLDARVSDLEAERAANATVAAP